MKNSLTTTILLLALSTTLLTSCGTSGYRLRLSNHQSQATDFRASLDVPGETVRDSLHDGTTNVNRIEIADTEALRSHNSEVGLYFEQGTLKNFNRPVESEYVGSGVALRHHFLDETNRIRPFAGGRLGWRRTSIEIDDETSAAFGVATGLEIGADIHIAQGVGMFITLGYDYSATDFGGLTTETHGPSFGIGGSFEW